MYGRLFSSQTAGMWHITCNRLISILKNGHHLVMIVIMIMHFSIFILKFIHPGHLNRCDVSGEYDESLLSLPDASLHVLQTVPHERLLLGALLNHLHRTLQQPGRKKSMLNHNKQIQFMSLTNPNENVGNLNSIRHLCEHEHDGLRHAPGITITQGAVTSMHERD